jgi:hypothetical protein
MLMHQHRRAGTCHVWTFQDVTGVKTIGAHLHAIARLLKPENGGTPTQLHRVIILPFPSCCFFASERHHGKEIPFLSARSLLPQHIEPSSWSLNLTPISSPGGAWCTEGRRR